MRKLYRFPKITLPAEANRQEKENRALTTSRDKQGLLAARQILDSEELLWQLTKRREKKSTPVTNRKKWKPKAQKEPEAGPSSQN